MSLDDVVLTSFPVDDEEKVVPPPGETSTSGVPSRPPAGPGDATRVRRTGGARSVAGTALRWVLGTLVAVIIVVYALSPLFEQRDQHKLLTDYRTQIRQSSLEATGLYGLTLPDEPPASGAPVGILEIGRLHVQAVVTEGVGPSQTEKGPGHVPGTAGLGQPGNSAVVARRSAFGGTFGDLGSLRKGDPIVVTTTEGQSLYVVSQVRKVTLSAGTTSSTASLGLSIGPRVSAPPAAPAKLGARIGVDDLYGVSATNRLTLVTSDSVLPWSSSAATVVVATMKTTPFTPTPQQARSANEDGRSGSSGAWPPLLLALQAFVLVAVGAVVLYRRIPIRSAYLISTAPLVVTTVLLAVAVSRLFPAWT